MIYEDVAGTLPGSDGRASDGINVSPPVG